MHQEKYHSLVSSPFILAYCVHVVPTFCGVKNNSQDTRYISAPIFKLRKMWLGLIPPSASKEKEISLLQVGMRLITRMAFIIVHKGYLRFSRRIKVHLKVHHEIFIDKY